MKKALKVFALAVCLIGSVSISYNLFTSKAKHEEAPKKLGSIVRLVGANGATFCSGTVIAPNLILTAAHCVVIPTPFGNVMNSGPIEIRDADNVERMVYGRALYATGQLDQALLTGDFRLHDTRKIITEPDRLTTIKNTPRLKLVSCGYPLWGNFYCSQMDYLRPIGFMWATLGTLLPGMSGGPVMLPDGTVVGVNVAVEDRFSIVSPIYNILFAVDLVMKEHK